MTLSLCVPAIGNAQMSEYDMNKPVGWGTVQKNITGGEGGDYVTVTTEAELKTALKSGDTTPRIIYVKGSLQVSTLQTYNGVCNKTIYGLPGSVIYNTNRTKSDGGLIKFTNGCDNIILRNLTIKGPGAYDMDGDDGLLLQTCTNVWVDHCDIEDGMDGNFDCTNGSDYLSITWCRFRYLIPPLAGGSGGAADHRNCNLWGNSDKNAAKDEGHLNTTFANCWWDTGCHERCPRVRFGKVHVINCLYTNVNNDYSVGYGYKSNLYVEKCYFADKVVPTADYSNPKKGYPDYNITLTDCLGADDMKKNVGSITYFNPADYYDYKGFDKNLVLTVVGNEKNGAGATLNVVEGKGVVNSAVDGIAPLVTGSNAIASTSYYSQSGMRLSAPQKGFNIIRYVMSDGSVKTRSIIIR